MDAGYVYVGCRTSVKRNARGKGIKVFKIEATTGCWSEVQLVEGVENPSFLSFDKNKEFLYSVHGDEKIVSAFKIDQRTGCLSFLNNQRTGFDFTNAALDVTRGYNPVHLAVDPQNRCVIIANHATGNITVHRRNSDGSIGPYTSVKMVTGNSQKTNQDLSFSRPHQICFDVTGQYVLVPIQGRFEGNGIDKILVYKFLGDSLQECCKVDARLRSWPRHIVMHPNNRFAYVINEWDNTVASYTFDVSKGSLEGFQVLPSLPETYTGNGQAAEILIHPSGKFVYASNRIHNSIVLYHVDKVTGFLQSKSWINCQGQTPRFMAINLAGDRLYVANEDSDDIIEFLIDGQTGLLEFTGQKIVTESPVCIIFS